MFFQSIPATNTLERLIVFLHNEFWVCGRIHSGKDSKFVNHMTLQNVNTLFENQLHIYVSVCTWVFECQSVNWSECLSAWVSECLNVWVSECLSVWVSECLSIWASEHLSIWASECLSVWTSECLSVWASEHLSVWTSEHLSIWASEFLSVSLSECLSVSLVTFRQTSAWLRRGLFCCHLILRELQPTLGGRWQQQPKWREKQQVWSG